MAQECDLEARLCLVWNTSRPDLHSERISSYFSFRKSEWRLRLKCRTAGKFCRFEILLQREATESPKEEKLEESFRTTTYIESAVMGGFISSAEDAQIEETEEVVWYSDENELRETVPDLFSDGGTWRIVCTFCVPMRVVMLDKMVHLDVNRKSWDFPSDLQSLSVDFSNLLKDMPFPDVELRCPGGTFSAHRTMLAARSQKFAGMFRNKTRERKTGDVYIEDLKPRVLEMLAKFLYTGKLGDVSEVDVLNLYYESNKDLLLDLKKKCSDWMIRHVTKDNCSKFLCAAEVLRDDDFKKALVLIISGDKSILASKEWLKFADESPRLANEVYQRHVRSVIGN